MTSVLLLALPDGPPLAADFAAMGFDVLGEAGCAQLVQLACERAPEVVACWARRPDAALWEAIATLQSSRPTPLLLFTEDDTVESMERALAAGVHAWVVRGYARERLPTLVQLAVTRARHERAQSGRLAELAEKLQERKWVDRAKGILMRAQQVSEDEAFQLLRSASMAGSLRLGQLSREVIEVARSAEAINRAGQQRMLSQRLVKLYALACSRTDAPAAALLMKESAQRVEDNLAALDGGLVPVQGSEELAKARSGWAAMRALLQDAPRPGELPRLDAAADAVLAQADALVQALEASGLAPRVNVVNVAGRQRMLSQRYAKFALLGDASALQEVGAEFERGLHLLALAPLSTPEIRILLGRGETAWRTLKAAVAGAGETSGRRRVAAASEELLEIFDELTGMYQHSVQVLMGG